NGWTSFRSIQLKAYEHFVGDEKHILISAGTSSGKTEAAMFPVISSLYQEPVKGIGALYIGPLKALIDDQFERIDPILRDSGIKITGWHGDISHSTKMRSLKEPSGILQITPESLQNIISNRQDELSKLFANLRFVVIDEIHAFMNSDRGLQLLCCLERIEKLTGCKPRRLGLSATISDTSAACRWLSANTNIETTVVEDDSVGERQVEIRYNMFPTPNEEEGVLRQKAVTKYYRSLFSDIVARSCIVFTNSRDSAEKTSRSLNKMAELNNRPGEIYIHHGSVSRELRQNAEEALKNRERKITVVSTVTLELGIDVGNLDRIVQVGTPYTCSSMMQRMGRSGRRGNSQNLVIYVNDDLANRWAEVDGMSVDLVRSIAMTELALKEKWVESPSEPKLPYSLLYHQTLHYLKSGIGSKLQDLYNDVLSMYPFRNIPKDDYKTLLRHMLKIGHIERMDDGTYLLAEKGERIAFNREFCSVFTTGKEFEIKFEGKSIGSIQIVPHVGDLIQLAGRIWEVTSVNTKDYSAEVVESDGTVSTPWSSGIPGIDTKVLKKMKEVLMTADRYPYLDQDAEACLRYCRSLGHDLGIENDFVPTQKGFRIYPWLGSRQFDTLKRALLNIPDVSAVRARQPYYIELFTELSESDLRAWVNDVLETSDGTNLIQDNDDLRIGKFDMHVPESLLKKQFVADQLDMDFEL
ncbi:MAG: DEAD/DEAH box helicase, partial [archaeon]|nr:DEAD/DEAH box helicase [archaeon]